MDDACIYLLLLAAIVLVVIALAVYIHNTNSQKRKKTTMYYIQGTIDAVELEAPHLKLKRFSLLPSSEYLLILPDGENKALFIESTGKKQACLIKTSKTSGTKPVVFFKSSSCCDVAMSTLLIQAKHDHATIRVCVRPEKDERSNAVPYPNIEDVAEIHLI